MIIVLMGPPGSGKSSLGKELAISTEFSHYDMDDVMSKDLEEKMRNDKVATEQERDSFMKSFIVTVRELEKKGPLIVSGVFTREHHRQLLHDSCRESHMFYLEVPLEVLKERLKSRTDHFFRESILTKAIEMMDPVDRYAHLNGTKPLEENVKHIVDVLRL